MNANDRKGREHAEPQAQRAPHRRKQREPREPREPRLKRVDMDGDDMDADMDADMDTDRTVDRTADGTANGTVAKAKTRDLRERVWELHLRGVHKGEIAVQVGLHRNTVGRYIADCYREFGAERRARLKRKLESAVAHMQYVQRQAWVDHDADDARERAVLAASTPGVRYQSQRSAYLRLALDAEKEIARLEGLYADEVSDAVAIVFRIERVVSTVSGMVVREERPSTVAG